MIIRRATLDDAATLAEFAERTFRDTFGRDNSAQDMDRYVAEHFGVERQRAELAEPRGIVLLMELAGDVVGYAQLLVGSAPSEIVATPAIELQRFYIIRDFHGRGFAQRLMESVLSTTRDQGSIAVWLGVWERNDRAISFYVKSGFADVGSQLFVLGDDRQTDRIMYRATSG